jgi:hypothetical protein
MPWKLSGTRAKRRCTPVSAYDVEHDDEYDDADDDDGEESFLFNSLIVVISS